MKELPILFKGEMVRAILEGRKTQTRRIVKQAINPITGEVAGSVNKDGSGIGYIAWFPGPVSDAATARCYPGEDGFKCPYGTPGDRLWVRETWAEVPYPATGPKCKMLPDGRGVTFRSDWNGNPSGFKWRPSIHMPRSASRITLENIGVRVERLQEISEDDAIAEGLKCLTKDGSLYKYGIADRDGLPGNDDDGWHWREWEKDPRLAYKKLWQSINGPGSWEANPWVWVIEFKRV